MNRIILLTAILSAVFASQYVSIPKKEIGLFTGDKNAEIQIELIYDPICDDTAQFDTYFQTAFGSLTSDQKEKISIRFIPFALPFHMASQKIVQGIIHVMEQKGHESAIELLRSFLTTKEEWYENKVREESVNDLIQRIAQKISNEFGLPIENTLKELTAGSKVETKAKKWSKIIMGSLKIAGTPRLIINKASIDNAVSLKKEKISEILNSLFVNEENDEN